MDQRPTGRFLPTLPQAICRTRRNGLSDLPPHLYDLQKNKENERKCIFCEWHRHRHRQSYATSYLAKLWNGQGIRTITQKLIQTGNNGLSEDIELHRRIMGTGLLPEDTDGLTMPEIFSYPCSPHLAAEIDKRPVDFDKIERATRRLSETYDAVLLEGAGGLMVPSPVIC